LAVYHHSHVRWIYNQPGECWHGLNEETGLPLCSSDYPKHGELHDTLPEEIIKASQINIASSHLCAACARVVKLHRG